MTDAQAVALVTAQLLAGSRDAEQHAMLDLWVGQAADILEKCKLTVRARQVDATRLEANGRLVTRAELWVDRVIP